MLWLLLAGSVAVLLLIFFCNWRITTVSQPYLYEEVSQVPTCNTALVLGTSQKLANGAPNLFFQYRMEAAVSLYEAGKIQYFILSGDNGRESYNEPADMKRSLIALGIPEERLFLDYAGFRTLDSVIRAQKIFGQSQLLVVSQAFHNERAVYIARHLGIEAYGFNAKTLSLKAGFRTYLREKLARVKVFIDLTVKQQPKFLGAPVTIPQG